MLTAKILHLATPARLFRVIGFCPQLAGLQGLSWPTFGTSTSLARQQSLIIVSIVGQDGIWSPPITPVKEILALLEYFGHSDYLP